MSWRPVRAPDDIPTDADRDASPLDVLAFNCLGPTEDRDAALACNAAVVSTLFKNAFISTAVNTMTVSSSVIIRPVFYNLQIVTPKVVTKSVL